MGPAYFDFEDVLGHAVYFVVALLADVGHGLDDATVGLGGGGLVGLVVACHGGDGLRKARAVAMTFGGAGRCSTSEIEIVTSLEALEAIAVWCSREVRWELREYLRDLEMGLRFGGRTIAYM